MEQPPAQLHDRGGWGVAMAGTRGCRWGDRRQHGRRQSGRVGGTLGQEAVRGERGAAAATAAPPPAGAPRLRAPGHAADTEGGAGAEGLATAGHRRQRIVSFFRCCCCGFFGLRGGF